MKVLSQRDLKDKGIPWSREHVRRKVKEGEVPPPFKLTEKGRNVWDEEAVDAWLEERRAARP
jgi:predicted DNA-binding transcriptional regulator AlpA